MKETSINMSLRPRVNSTTENVVIKKTKRGKKRKREPFDPSPHDLTTLKGLIDLASDYEAYTTQKRRCTKNGDYESLIYIKDELKELEALVGMKDVKREIAQHILFFIQELNDNQLMHTILAGNPGTGKTTLGKILGTIYTELGFLSKGHFVIATRADFIGEYLGSTALKTKKLLASCKGGVLFIDEAYSLGPPAGGRDSYSKEAIDTLNQFLSENSDDFICIIAGYEDSLQKSFFNMNSGLRRRFPWKYKIKNYSANELCDIFIYQMKETYWELQDKKDMKAVYQLFEKEKLLFSDNGGDTKNLLDKCKLYHAQKIFGKNVLVKKKLTIQDITEGFNLFKKYKENIKKNTPPVGLYM